MTTKKPNKYLYGWKLYVKYEEQYGYEYELFEYTRKEIKDRIREYRTNCPQYPIKVSKGRESNPDYVKWLAKQEGQ